MARRREGALDTGRRARTARRRRRRLLRALLRAAFWVLVMAGVFVLGIGTGRLLGDDTATKEQEIVTIDQEVQTIEATLPVRTETTTITVTRPARPARPAAGGARRG